jgi:hypothetical protein
MKATNNLKSNEFNCFSSYYVACSGNSLSNVFNVSVRDLNLVNNRPT